jgi:hypothetical protein
MDLMKCLENDFNKYNNTEEYDKLNTEFNSLVKNKIISKCFLYNIHNYEEETYGFKKGKEIKKMSKNTKNIFVYYFNENGKIIVIDKYGNSANILDKEFCFYDNNTIRTIYYSSPKHLRNVTLSTEIEGKTDKIYNYGKYGQTVKQYIYKNNMVERIEVQTKEHDTKEYKTHELVFEFNDDELIKINQIHKNGYIKEVYNKK